MCILLCAISALAVWLKKQESKKAKSTLSSLTKNLLSLLSASWFLDPKAIQNQGSGQKGTYLREEGL